MARVRVTESLLVDTGDESWRCRECETELIGVDENYKKGCLVAERDPTEVHDPVVDEEYTFAPDPEWCRIIEFYCPSCGLMIENEYLPPGHPITKDIDIDVAELESMEAERSQ